MKKKKNKKIYIKDTIKNITKNPEYAIKADYEQTKADMENLKDEALDLGKRGREENKK